jgi:hypothetical protein
VRQEALRALLTECAAERVALVERHEAGARLVGHYDFNNVYQYIIAREDTHLTWLESALFELGASLPAAAARLPVPSKAGGRRVGEASCREVLEDDARLLGAFVARWRARVAEVTHARHRQMVDVIVGESVEHQRLFEQAALGVEDVLGRRTPGAARVGAVLPTRWME